MTDYILKIFRKTRAYSNFDFFKLAKVTPEVPKRLVQNAYHNEIITCLSIVHLYRKNYGNRLR